MFLKNKLLFTKTKRILLHNDIFGQGVNSYPRILALLTRKNIKIFISNICILCFYVFKMYQYQFKDMIISTTFLEEQITWKMEDKN